MPKFDIAFKVDGKTQTLTAVGNKKIRAGSKNYWYATFTFLDNSFDGLEYLSASFSRKPYSPDRTDAIIVPIVNGECQIPWEMMTKKRKFYVGVFAGDMLVTNEEILEVTAAAPNGGMYSEPTSSWFSMFMEGLRAKQNKLTAGDNIEIDENDRISAILTDVVLYAEQELTEEEKLQARNNIGAGTEEVFKVRFAVGTSSLGPFCNMITSYADFSNALISGKTLWARVETISGIYYLRNFYQNNIDMNYIFWDVCSFNPEFSVGELQKISFDSSHATMSKIEIASIEDIPTSIVLYEPQELEESEKFIARENIGAGTDQTYFIEFEEQSIYRRYASISSYNEYLALKARKATLSAKVQLENDEEIILKNFTDEGNSVYFWNLIPSVNGTSPAVIQYMNCLDNGERLISYSINEVELAGSTSVQERLDEKAQKVARTIISTNGDVSAILESNVVYWFTGEIDSLDITLDPRSSEPEVLYHFYYKAGEVAPMILLPNDIGYASGATDALASTNTLIEVTISEIPSITINDRTYNYLAYAGRMEDSSWRSER